MDKQYKINLIVAAMLEAKELYMQSWKDCIYKKDRIPETEEIFIAKHLISKGIEFPESSEERTAFKVGDLVVVNRFDTGVITYIYEEEGTADVEIERYDYKTELPYKLKDLEKFSK